MDFLDEHRWSGKIFTGEWVVPDGGTIPVVEPATGIEIARVGEASLGDLERRWLGRVRRKTLGPQCPSPSGPR